MAPSNDELKTILNDFQLLKLYPKLNDAGITSSVLWEIPDELLKDEIGFTGIELLLYKKAKQVKEAKERDVTKKPGKISKKS